MAASSLVESALRVRSALEARERDPLAWWRFAVPRLHEAFALFTDPDPIEELHLRASNKGTKTETQAAWMLACLQKRPELDGVPVPQWRGPVEGAQFVLDFKAQLLSVQPAYLRLLGRWPYHARYSGEVLTSLRVKPIGASDNEAEWSVVHFLSQENRRSGVGVRADVAAFDEPPVIEILREMRKAAHAGRPSIRLIAETPTIRRQWAPLLEDYGDTPRRSIRRVDRERAECRWSLDDVSDWVLSPAEKAKLRRIYAKDPLREAREHGDYISTEGACPFNLDTLLAILGDCREPEIETIRAVREGMNGEPTTLERVPLQVWEKPQQGQRYYISIDPSSGIDDGRHNPACLHVVKLGPCDLVARWNGYLAPFTLGALAAAVGRQYANALVDVEMKDHWGVNVIRGLAHSKYPNVGHEMRELRPGEFAKEAGFDMNEETRTVIIGCIQDWVEARSAGIRYAECPSRQVIESIMDTELDDRGKIVAGQGVAHGEDVVCWGRALQKALSRSSRMIPEMRPALTAEQELARRIFGKNGKERPPGDGGLLRLRS